MDKKAAAERLLLMASSHPNRSKTARLRDVIDEVEAALAAGVPRADVLAELKTLGLEMSLSTFQGSLYRLRAKRKSSTAPPASPPTGRVNNHEAPPTAPPGSIESGGASHNPADITRILRSRPDLDALSKHAKRNLK